MGWDRSRQGQTEGRQMGMARAHARQSKGAPSFDYHDTRLPLKKASKGGQISRNCKRHMYRDGLKSSHVSSLSLGQGRPSKLTPIMVTVGQSQ